MRLLSRLLLGAFALLVGTALVRGDDRPPVSFETQVLPLLTARCGKCHGDTKQSAGLKLTSGASLLKGGESGEIVISGKPDESPLYELIRDGAMPPTGNGSLTMAEIDTVRRWISQGAKVSDGPREASAVTQHQIVPLMLLRCVPCHGGRRREADLDLRTKAGMLKGGKSGPAVVPGKPDESLIVRRIVAEEMPPRRQLVSVSVKPMEAAELAKLKAWVAAGLPEAPSGLDGQGTEPDRLVSDDDRKFWAFQPPVRTPPPVLAGDGAAGLENPIDGFILAKLQEHGLAFSPEADRATLIRRLSFDLIGLPPAPEDVAAYVEDADPLAYENLVDRLLSSPHYGERWARHWLDAAGYADSEGAQNEDRVRPHLWRYRDYVIRAFNADKPYDRFLHEQIAGDELADYEHAPEITPELYDNLVATGFLRTAPDRTFANITNFVPDRLEVIADEIQILGSAVFGLTLHCCRCHTHKFDPLPQRDYYRLAAALKDGLDEHDWLGPEQRQLKFVTTAERTAWERHEQELTSQITPLKAAAEKEPDPKAKKTLENQIQALEAKRRPEPAIRALWSRGDPSPTYVLQRGNYLTPGAEVSPGVPSVLTNGRTPFRAEAPYPGARATGRRLALARWLTTDNHPLTARVMVNRVWRQHFGSGLVTTPGNFGKTGAPPTHPELLDWLAREFIDRGWGLKSLHRLIVTSKTWRQSSHRSEQAAVRDPENRYLSHVSLRRIEAESLRDSLLSVAGQLDLTPFGPPDDVDVRGDGLVTAKGTRRSIYVLHRRTKLPTLLESFDSPQMGPNCLERGESIVAPQALHLLNNAAVHNLAVRFAERVEREAGSDVTRQLMRAQELAYSRVPREDETRTLQESYEALVHHWRRTLPAGPTVEAEAARRALRNTCHALMNSAGFAYVD